MNKKEIYLMQSYFIPLETQFILQITHLDELPPIGFNLL